MGILLLVAVIGLSGSAYVYTLNQGYTNKLAEYTKVFSDKKTKVIDKVEVYKDTVKYYETIKNGTLNFSDFKYNEEINKMYEEINSTYKTDIEDVLSKDVNNQKELKARIKN